MAVKILKIQLEADTSGLVKLSKVADDVESSLTKVVSKQERLNSLEVHKKAILDEQAASYARLQGIVDRANIAIENKARGYNLAENNAIRATEVHNKLLQEQIGILNDLKGKQEALRQYSLTGASSGAANIGPASAPTGKGVSGLGFIGADTIAATKHKEALDKQAFDDKAYINKRTIDFAAMFDTIAAKEARLANTIRDARTLAPASASGTGAIQSLTGGTAQANIAAKKAREADEQRIAGFQTMINRMSLLERIHTATVVGELNNQSNAAKAAYKARQADLERAFAPTKSETDKVVKDLEKEANAHKSLANSVISSTLIYKAFNVVLHGVRSALLAIPMAGIAEQTSKAAVTAAFGTEQGLRNLAFVKDLAEKAGASLLVLEEGYRKYAISATLAGATQSDINKSFTDFTKVGTVLHLTSDKMQSVFLALDQMYAKSTVQSEEIKKQLGNVLPGAVEIGAKAMKMTPAVFMDTMKKNLVITKEFVPKFAEEYKNMIAGVDDTAFTSAADMLNANLMRVQNRYIEFNRAIFAQTQSTMTFVVKGVVSIFDGINANLGTVLQGVGVALALVTVRVTQLTFASIVGTAANSAYGKSFATVAAASGRGAATLSTLRLLVLGLAGYIGAPVLALTGLGIAIGAMATNFTSLEVSIGKFTGTSKAGIDSLMKTYAAGGAAAAEAGAQLEEIAKIQETNNSLLIEYGNTQLELSTIAQVAWENIKNSAEQALTGISAIAKRIAEDIKVAIIAMFDIIPQRLAAIAGSIASKIDFTKNIVDNIFSLKSLTSDQWQGFRDSAAAANKSVQQDTLDTFGVLSKGINKVTTAASDGVKSLIKGPKEVVSGTLTAFAEQVKQAQLIKNKLRAGLSPTIDTPEAYVELPGVDKAKKGSASEAAEEARDAYRADLEAIKQEFESLRQVGAEKLEALSNEFTRNKVAIVDYFNSKADLQRQDIGLQKAMLEAESKVAFASGDRVKVAKLSLEIEKLQRAETKQNIALKYEEIDANIAYGDTLSKINADYLAFQGKRGEAEALRIQTEGRAVQDRLKVEAASGGDKGKAIQALKQLETLNKHRVLTAELSKLDVERTQINTAYNDAINKTNTLKEIGAISEFTAAIQMKEANMAQIASLKTMIALEKEKIDTAKEGASVTDIAKYDADIQRLKLLELTADTVAQTIETKLGGAFDSAFASMVAGTATAKEAFASFTASVVQDIAKMIAQEARSALLRPLINAGMGALGGIFGGSSATMSAGTAVAGSGWPTAAANGHAVSGISAASGSVLSTPTYFPSAKVIPFASGGVLAGEAGKEAVLPLKRGKGGKLGVAMEGGSTASVTNIYQIQVESTSGEDGSALAAKIAEAIAKRVAKEEIANASRAGNINNRVTKFG